MSCRTLSPIRSTVTCKIYSVSSEFQLFMTFTWKFHVNALNTIKRNIFIIKMYCVKIEILMTLS